MGTSVESNINTLLLSPLALAGRLGPVPVGFLAPSCRRIQVCSTGRPRHGIVDFFVAVGIQHAEDLFNLANRLAAPSDHEMQEVEWNPF